MKRVTLLLLLTFGMFSQLLAQSIVAQSPGDESPNLPCQDGSCLETLLQSSAVNRLNYYHDPAKLNAIKRLESKGKLDALQSALCTYVSNFGITNFQKEIHLVWNLAMVTEQLGDVQSARSLYQLVLKHNNQGLDLRDAQWFHDSIHHRVKGQHVPLELYNQLVESSRLLDSVEAPHGSFHDLGKSINTHHPEYAPAFNSGTNTLLFTSQRHLHGITPGGQNEDLYISTRDENEEWSHAKKLDHVNTKYNEGSGCLNADGTILYFSRCNSDDSYGSCDLFVAYKQENGMWGGIRNLGPNVNSTAWDSHPTLSHSGDTLFFASDRRGGFGQSDLYFTVRDMLGKWSTPRNMGPFVNTKQHDVSPFYHPQEEVLYYSSNGQPFTYGEFDIYKVERTATAQWADPTNLGPQVNHKGSEMYFTIDATSNLMFFARSATNDLRRQDIFSFPLPMEAHPLAKTELTGSVTEELTGEPLTGIVSIIDLDEGVEVVPKYINADGTFSFDLIDNRNYQLVVRGKDFFRVEEPFFLSGPMALLKRVSTLPEVLEFQSVNFDFDKADLKDVMVPDLIKVVKFLFDNPGYLLDIAGHTDSEGSHEYNINLSQARAKSIHDYILQAGVEAHRVTSKGYGKTQPVVAETTEDHQAANRRVEFRIYKADKEFFSQSTTPIGSVKPW